MSTTNYASPARLAKRSRPSEVALEDNMQTRREGTKRRRTSTGDDVVGGHPISPNTLELSQKLACNDATSDFALSTDDKDATRPSDGWSLTRGIAGQFTHLDPILSADEQ